MKIRVCIAGRNTAAFAEECIRSVASQRLGKDDVIVDWTDDASGDGSYEIAEKTLREYAVEYVLVRTKARMGGLRNLRMAELRAAKEERETGEPQVCVYMGGDDRLEPDALTRILREYEDPECWATYGNFRNHDGRTTNRVRAWEAPYATRPPKEFIWIPFTYRAWLAAKIHEEDLMMAGSYFMSSGDSAHHTPMVEMAGPEHVRLIEEKWYVRNIHPGNDGWVDPGYQFFTTLRAYQKPRYSRLRDCHDVPTRSPHVLPYGLVIMPNEPFPRLLALDEWAEVEMREGRAVPVDGFQSEVKRIIDEERSKVEPLNGRAMPNGTLVEEDVEPI